MNRTYHVDGSSPVGQQVFVFGSNMAGSHYGGAAREAFENYGAAWDQYSGRSGQSYAIPTMDVNFVPLSIDEIGCHVRRFIEYAKAYPHERFFVTRIGCGIAGHHNSDIVPFFAGAPENCSLPDTWAQHLSEFELKTQKCLGGSPDQEDS